MYNLNFVSAKTLNHFNRTINLAEAEPPSDLVLSDCG